MLRLRADARRSTQFDDRRLFSAGEHDRTHCTKNSAVSRAERCGAGLSPDLRDSTYFFPVDGKRNFGPGPALREKHGTALIGAVSPTGRIAKIVTIPFAMFGWKRRRAFALSYVYALPSCSALSVAARLAGARKQH